VQSNVWDPGDGAGQTISFSGVSFTVTAHSGTNSTAEGPISYPSVFIGSNFGRNTSGSNLPKLVSSIANVPTGWSHNASSAIAGTFNAAYDVWFSTGSGNEDAPSGGYLMVWLYDPPNAQPLGAPSQNGFSLAGATWDVWIDNGYRRPVISYVRTQPTPSMEFDLNIFIQDAVRRGTIQSGWYLSNIFAGFEIWQGGVGLKTNNFCAIVN
jgi:hypothetical protein